MEEITKRIMEIISIAPIDYGDVRIVEEKVETIKVKDGRLEAIIRSENRGFGIRILKNGAWGFASSGKLEKKEIEKVVKRAREIADASSFVKGRYAELSELMPQKGNYTTKIKKDPFLVPLEEKISLLVESTRIMKRVKGIRTAKGMLYAKRIKKIFANNEGSYIVQEIIFTGGGIEAWAIERNEAQRRSYPCGFGNFSQRGYEFIEEMNLLKNAEKTAEEARMLLSAKPCPEEETTVVLGSNQMVLQVHESVGHPSELDRVLGTEVSYAGGSFLGLRDQGNLKYAAEIVSITADATLEGGLGSFGWDDEGVPAQRFYIIENGVFKNFLTSRETAAAIGERSNGTMRAGGWARIPLIRMTNINLEPGDKSFEEIIGEVNNGVYMETNKSWSIDNKRLNFHFGTEIAWRIKKGRLTEVYKNPVYTGITPVFWNSCDGVGDKNTMILWGVPNCGKGEPGQSMEVGHRTPVARFRNVKVGSTGA